MTVQVEEMVDVADVVYVAGDVRSLVGAELSPDPAFGGEVGLDLVES